MKEATLGAGCFWCIEACYKEMNGIVSVTSGYAGGHVLNPTYKQVCEGTTGHAEVARIVYDENQISFADLLKVFWFIHDPTQLNRQGNDVGTQYRSVIFFHDEEQRQIAESYKQKLIDEQVWDRPIVTEISPLPVFYAAEDYHQDYYDLNPGNAYCQAIVRPKVEKFKKVFEANLKA
ncbi:MAG: peptide-methionine (S)-S-oxide reductase MsrA [Fluviicola sp.]|nr:peptide-methionine (S)-S-oxide reductase MsrA [Fluviicola sp.]